MFHFDWLKRHAERTPDKLALVDAHTGRTFTYAEFNERANRFASFLKDTLGLKQGDRVSILAQNGTDYYEVLFACGKMGAILNTLNWRLAVPELEFILNDCSPRVLIYEPMFAEAVRGAAPSHRLRILRGHGARRASAGGRVDLRASLGGRRAGGSRDAAAQVHRHLGHPLHLWHNRSAQGRPGDLWQLFLQRRGHGRGD